MTVVLGGLQSKGRATRRSGTKVSMNQMRPAKLASKLLHETAAIPLFACIPMLRQAASGLQHCRALPHHTHSHGRTLTCFAFLPKDAQGNNRLLTVNSSIKKCREMTHKNNNHQFGIPHLNFTLVSFIKKIKKNSSYSCSTWYIPLMQY